MSLLVEPRPIFDHLIHLSDDRGLMEHALFAEPRAEHGYCVDDVARGLVVVCRESAPDASLARLGSVYLDFVLAAVAANGRCHNRMDTDGEWTDTPTLGDWWGRAIWALGIAAGSARTPGMRARALNGFRVAAQQRSPHLRAMVFATLGAAQLLRTHPNEVAAGQLVTDASLVVNQPALSPEWPWPEPRLTYANAAVVEALLLIGETADDTGLIQRGLELLAFLIDLETVSGHLSVTPVGGRGPGEHGPAFDQQPVEVAALADACATAYRITGESQWLDGIRLSWGWFLGDNDSMTPMFDQATGGGYDGLETEGCNLNQGAESTLAMLSTAQQARSHAGAM